jgi:hypothetical protein
VEQRCRPAVRAARISLRRLLRLLLLPSPRRLRYPRHHSSRLRLRYHRPSLRYHRYHHPSYHRSNQRCRQIRPSRRIHRSRHFHPYRASCLRRRHYRNRQPTSRARPSTWPMLPTSSASLSVPPRSKPRLGRVGFAEARPIGNVAPEKSRKRLTRVSHLGPLRGAFDTCVCGVVYTLRTGLANAK